jgi:PAS domain-containing protein
VRITSAAWGAVRKNGHRAVSVIAGRNSGLLIHAIEQVGDGVLLIDEHNIVLWLNAAAVAICGWPRGAGRTERALAPPEMRERYDTEQYPGERNRMLELLADPHDIRMIRKDGLCRWISSLSDPGRRAPRPSGGVPRRHRATRPAAPDAPAVDGSDGSRNAVVVTDTDGRIVYVNAGFTACSAIPKPRRWPSRPTC